MLILEFRPKNINQYQSIIPKMVFYPGAWISLTNGKAKLAQPFDNGQEQVYAPGNTLQLQGTITTIYEYYIGKTDQYKATSKIVDNSNLTTRDGLLDLAGAGEKIVAMAIGEPISGMLRFKRI